MELPCSTEDGLIKIDWQQPFCKIIPPWKMEEALYAPVRKNRIFFSNKNYIYVCIQSERFSTNLHSRCSPRANWLLEEIRKISDPRAMQN